MVCVQVHLAPPLLPDPSLTRVSLVMPIGAGGVTPGTSFSLVVAMGTEAGLVKASDVAPLAAWPGSPSATLC